MTISKKVDKPGKSTPELIEHWYTLVPGHTFSPIEFYDSIEADIAAQKFPALMTSRVDLAEGGVLSDKRVYLRMKRERLTFDVCAAPVGINFFFSYRFYVERMNFRFSEFVLTGLFSVGIFWALSAMVGFLIGALVLVSSCLLSFAALPIFAAKGSSGLDGFLIYIPLLGTLYERYFRRDTYYREDLRIAYCSIVSAIVKERVEKLIATQGVELVRQFNRSPGFGELYDVKERAIGAAV